MILTCESSNEVLRGGSQNFSDQGSLNGHPHRRNGVEGVTQGLESFEEHKSLDCVHGFFYLMPLV